MSNEEMKTNVIAIDGPSGSGKSTIAKQIAENLGLTYLDTGSMFRALAYALDKAGLEQHDEVGIRTFLDNLSFDYQSSDDCLVSINSEDLTEKIRQHHVSKLASKFSQVTSVRDYLKTIQRSVSEQVPSILDGRDIGTVIFPDAILKVFLVADAKVRAERRLEQLQEKDSSLEYEFDKILADINTRDRADEQRSIAPLKKADDAVEIDSTKLSVEEIVQQVTNLYHSRLN